MSARSLVFKPLHGQFSVLKMSPVADVPRWALAAGGALSSITRTPEELSIVCLTSAVPASASGVAVSTAVGSAAEGQGLAAAAVAGGATAAAAAAGTASATANDAIIAHEPGWAALAIDMGPLPFGLTGVLLAALAPLAQAGIGIFAISTYNTDVVMVKQDNLDKAIKALTDAGHSVSLQ